MLIRRGHVKDIKPRHVYSCFSSGKHFAPRPSLVRRVHSQETGKRILSSPTIFSGIQPTGVPHLGNYLGALRSWVDLQDGADHPDQCIWCIVDFHALTVPQNSAKLLQWRRETLASLRAIGLDPKNSIIYYQSDVVEHLLLMWVLSTVASTGQLSRMTQWKSKLDLPDNANMEDIEARSKLRLGLFSYPVLQAADILIHQATRVPVGEDQVQHVEFARDVARSYNHVYGELFPLPEALISPAKRIMSLKEPRMKMSKSHPDPKSRILITDSEEEIKAKVKEALTDSERGITYDPIGRPGVSNLIEILKHTTQMAGTCEELARDMNSLSMLAFKERVSQAVIFCLSGIRDRYLELMAPDNKQLSEDRALGRGRARSHVDPTIQRVRKRVGLLADRNQTSGERVAGEE